jgi:MoaA/NifB/PqqE/SkfB family radical SAM enzyme
VANRFLRADLPEIIRAYHERCGFFTASIPTNGYSAERICATIERICAISPDLHLGIAVSLDGMKTFHDQVRQVPGLWDNAIRTLRAIVELTRRYPHLTVGVNTVFMRENQRDIEPLLNYIHDEVRPTFHALSFIRGKPVDGTLANDLDVDRYVELSRWIDDHYGSDANWNSGWRGVRARARRMINRERYEYIARQAKGGAFESDCLAGEREYVMTETGQHPRLRAYRNAARQRSRSRIRLRQHPGQRRRAGIRGRKTGAPMPLHARVQYADDAAVSSAQRNSAGHRRAGNYQD